mmetsp:Transcript_31493/g.62232  ORF Transcript_31493/g.62232 Transcript_31493/m.62232 type:complete len:111 (-) Transcript_31493:869-1201(-)
MQRRSHLDQRREREERHLDTKLTSTVCVHPDPEKKNQQHKTEQNRNRPTIREAWSHRADRSFEYRCKCIHEEAATEKKSEQQSTPCRYRKKENNGSLILLSALSEIYRES